MLFWILCWRRRLWRSACVVAEKIHGFCVERNNLCDQRWSTFIRTLISSHASLYCHIYDGVITADLHEALRRNSRQVKRHEEWDVSYARQRPESKKEKDCGVGNLVQVYRFFLQLVGHCISRKPLNKDYLYKGVGQLYLNKAGSAAMSSPMQEGPVHTWNISSKQLKDVENTWRILSTVSQMTTPKSKVRWIKESTLLVGRTKDS